MRSLRCVFKPLRALSTLSNAGHPADSTEGNFSLIRRALPQEQPRPDLAPNMLALRALRRAATTRIATVSTRAAHSHSHEHYDHPGSFGARDTGLPAFWATRDWASRAFTVGIGGPVGSGKTALTLALCRRLREERSLAVVTNDIFTREDAEFLARNSALEPDRIAAVETGGCPHAAIREDVSANLEALEALTATHAGVELLLCESGGDNLAAHFSSELADFSLYVIDVAGGDKVPRKGGPGITQSDVLVINKTDLAEAVGADLGVMDRDARKMRGDGPTVFASVKRGDGLEAIVDEVLGALDRATAAA